MKVSCLSEFDDKNMVPDDGMVVSALGDTFSIWEELRTHIVDNYPNITSEWKYYGKAAGWSCKFLSKKRNLLFFVPRSGSFRLRIVLGGKASACAEADSELPEEMKETIRTATPYTEGRSIDIDIKDSGQLETIKCLLKIKYEN